MKTDYALNGLIDRTVTQINKIDQRMKYARSTSVHRYLYELKYLLNQSLIKLQGDYRETNSR